MLYQIHPWNTWNIVIKIKKENQHGINRDTGWLELFFTNASANNDYINKPKRLEIFYFFKLNSYKKQNLLLLFENEFIFLIQ